MLADRLSKEGLGLERGVWLVTEDQDGLHSEFTHASFLYGFSDTFILKNFITIFCGWLYNVVITELFSVGLWPLDQTIC